MLLLTLSLIVCSSTPSNATPLSDLQAWTLRLPSTAPSWKRQLATSHPKTVSVKLTAYSDDDALDPGTGGGSWGCTWTNPNNTHCPGLALRYGLVAAETRIWPTGTVFYAPPPFDRLWIVADTGPAVRGRHIDVYCPTRETYQLTVAVPQPFTILHLGRITHDQARR